MFERFLTYKDAVCHDGIRVLFASKRRERYSAVMYNRTLAIYLTKITMELKKRRKRRVYPRPPTNYQAHDPAREIRLLFVHKRARDRDAVLLRLFLSLSPSLSVSRLRNIKRVARET